MNDSGKKLLLNYRNKLSLLPPFDEKNYNDVLLEIETLSHQIRQDFRNGKSEYFHACRVKHHCIDRNRRILLAYSRQRLMDIKKYRWQFGPILPKDIEQNMIPEEKLWLQDYNKILVNHMMKSCYGFDLTERKEPPQNLKIEVKCLEDYGEIDTIDGVVNLFKGSNHFLFLSDCENLINQGVLEHILD